MCQKLVYTQNWKVQIMGDKISNMSSFGQFSKNFKTRVRSTPNLCLIWEINSTGSGLIVLAGLIDIYWPVIKVHSLPVHLFCFISNAVIFNPLNFFKFWTSLLNCCLFYHGKFRPCCLFKKWKCQTFEWLLGKFGISNTMAIFPTPSYHLLV